jgi:hypothetical protein
MLWLVCVAPVSALGTTIQRVQLSTLVEHSDVVLMGVVAHVDEEQAPSKNGPFHTELVLEILEIFKGKVPLQSDGTFAMLLPGGRGYGRRLVIPGMPLFMLGEKVILLLEKTSLGYIPSALEQGVIRIGSPSNIYHSLSASRYVHRVGASEVEVLPSTLPLLLQTIRAHLGVVMDTKH